MPGLFDPLEIRGVTLRNRIVMPAMDQLAAGPGGVATDWHLVHYGARAVGGVGLILVEVTAVEPRGLIYDVNLGLWEDAQIEPLRRVARFCAAHGAAIGLQIGHAGRKAMYDDGGYGVDLVGPSPIPFDTGHRAPRELSRADIGEIVGAFASAARRGIQAGFQVIEVHSAHGYLLSSFLSPLANHRTDAYGGDIRARSRFPCEVVSAVRAEIPSDTPLSVRISGSDLAKGGNTAQDMVIAAGLLRGAGADVIHVSAGGNAPEKPFSYPGYLVPISETIRRGARVPTIAVGLIEDPLMAEEIVRNGRADLVGLGRELLRRPYWALHAARELGVDVPWPGTYYQAKR